MDKHEAPLQPLTESERLAQANAAALRVVTSQVHPTGVHALQESQTQSVHDASEADDAPQRGTVRLVAIIISLAVCIDFFSAYKCGRTWPVANHFCTCDSLPSSRQP